MANMYTNSTSARLSECSEKEQNSNHIQGCNVEKFLQFVNTSRFTPSQFTEWKSCDILVSKILILLYCMRVNFYLFYTYFYLRVNTSHLKPVLIRLTVNQ